LHAYPHLSKEGFGEVLTPPPSSPWAWGPDTLKAEGNIFENCFQSKKCSAGSKLTWAAPGTLASCIYKTYFNISVFSHGSCFETTNCNFNLILA